MTFIKKFISNLWLEAYYINEKNILRLLNGNPSAKLIDLGCDDGKLSIKFARKINTSNIYGVDIIEESLRLAKKKKIITIKADLNNKLPLSNNFFDIVIANQVIEHISNLDNFISEIFRILKKNGYAIISTENASSWCNIFASIMGWQIFSLTNITRKKSGLGNPIALHRNSKNTRQLTSWTHKTVLNYYGLIEFLKIYDFKVNRVLTSGYFPFPGFMAKLDKIHSHFITIKISK